MPICKKCHEICDYLGATVGGTKLYGCPKCGLVYYNPEEDSSRGLRKEPMTVIMSS